MGASSSATSIAQRYSTVAILLHWSIAALLIAQLGMGWRMHDATVADRAGLLPLHKSVGVLILLLTVARLAWRLNRRPPLDEDLTPTERALSHWVHGGFYALLLALPLTGWLMISGGRSGVAAWLFGVVPWPRLPLGVFPADAQAVISGFSDQSHTILAWTMVGLLALHLLGAMKHQFLSRDRVVSRMAPGVQPGAVVQPRLLAIPVIAVVAFALAWAVQAPTPPEPRPKVIQLASADAYLDVVQPLLTRRCGTCHNDNQAKGGLSLVSYPSLMEGGFHGPAVVPGTPERSELFRRITLDPGHKNFMPAEGRTPLSPSQIQAIRWWISVGAPATGSVRLYKVSDKARPELEQVLHLVPEKETSGGEESLPVVAKADPTAVAALQSAGFIVRPVDHVSNLVDVNRYRHTPLAADDLANLAKIKDQVRSLSIRESGLTDAQMGALAPMPNLVLLKLDDNPITDAGLGHLSGLTGLKALSLVGSKVTDAGLTPLARLPKLERVYVWNTGVQAAGLQRLKAANPKISVALETLTDQPRS